MESFAQKFHRLLKAKNTLILLGLDPDIDILSRDFPEEISIPEELEVKEQVFKHLRSEKLPDLIRLFSRKPEDSLEITLKNLITLCAIAMLAVRDEVIGVKFQSACFERLGVLGSFALFLLSDIAQSLDLISIFDGKRGDIGVTLRHYVLSYLSAGAPAFGFSFDAMTLNPLLGVDTWEALLPALNEGRQVFFLTYPSSPSASDFAEALVCGKPLYVFVTEQAKEFLHLHGLEGADPPPIGFVIGANKPEVCAVVREIIPNSLHLVPGVGAQGARLSEVARMFAGKTNLALFPISRALFYSYQKDEFARLKPAERVGLFIKELRQKASLFKLELQSALEF